MTDNEIIKALECCHYTDCSDCPIRGEGACVDNLPQYALDLINRQKAEIERLRDTIEKTDAAYFAKVGEVERLTTAEAEAIKKFAEKLKTALYVKGITDWTVDDIIDNLAKEMVGEK